MEIFLILAVVVTSVWWQAVLLGFGVAVAAGGGRILGKWLFRKIGAGLRSISEGIQDSVIDGVAERVAEDHGSTINDIYAQVNSGRMERLEEESFNTHKMVGSIVDRVEELGTKLDIHIEAESDNIKYTRARIKGIEKNIATLVEHALLGD